MSARESEGVGERERERERERENRLRGGGLKPGQMSGNGGCRGDARFLSRALVGGTSALGQGVNLGGDEARAVPACRAALTHLTLVRCGDRKSVV